MKKNGEWKTNFEKILFLKIIANWPVVLLNKLCKKNKTFYDEHFEELNILPFYD